MFESSQGNVVALMSLVKWGNPIVCQLIYINLHYTTAANLYLWTL